MALGVKRDDKAWIYTQLVDGTGACSNPLSVNMEICRAVWIGYGEFTCRMLGLVIISDNPSPEVEHTKSLNRLQPAGTDFELQNDSTSGDGGRQEHVTKCGDISFRFWLRNLEDRNPSTSKFNVMLCLDSWTRR